MFRVETTAPGLRRIVLPAIAGCDGPWSQPANVWVVGEQEPVVVDTGHASLRTHLVAALAELGIRPADVSKVLLTSLRPECAGNVDVFRDATRHVHDPDGAARQLKSVGIHAAKRAFAPARAIRDTFAGPTTWADIDLEQQELIYGRLPDGVGFLPVRDAQRVATQHGDADAISTPGAHATGTSWHFVGPGWLFCGQALVLGPEPVWDDVRALTSSITRVIQSAPRWLLPAVGEPERTPAIVFRSLSLHLNNLLTNLPSALDEDRSPAEVAWRDMGHWPDDLVGFAAAAQRFGLVLDELVASGIAQREGHTVVSRYTLGAADRPTRRATPR